jgi:hypothetical protein
MFYLILGSISKYWVDKQFDKVTSMDLENAVDMITFESIIEIQKNVKMMLSKLDVESIKFPVQILD